MGNSIPQPLTFHVEIRQDPATQQQAEDLQLFFARPDVVHALNTANPRLVYFARILLIPNNEPTNPNGTFGVQVVVVYEGESMTPLLDFMWGTPALRGLIQQLSSMEVPLPSPSIWERFVKWLKKIFGMAQGTDVPRPTDYEGFCGYVQYNNLTPLQTELHRGYDLSLEQVLTGFPAPPAITSGATPA